MKTLTLFLLSLSLYAQYPLQLDKIMRDSCSLASPIDTINFENYRYIFRVKGDTNLIHWDLIKSDKLYTDYWKVAGVSFYAVSHASMFLLPAIEADKLKHFAASAAIGAGFNIITYRITKKEWLSALISTVLTIGVGYGKECIDRSRGGVFNNKDMEADVAGAVYMNTGFTIFAHKKRKERIIIQP